MRAKNSALSRAIKISGGPSRFARALKVTPQVVNHWRFRGVPPGRCRQIEEMTGGEVTAAQLKPDVFGPRGWAA